MLWCFHTRARQRQDNDKTNVEPVHSYYAFHIRSDISGVKGIIGMHRFNSCLVVVLLWSENTITLDEYNYRTPKKDQPGKSNVLRYKVYVITAHWAQPTQLMGFSREMTLSPGGS